MIHSFESYLDGGIGFMFAEPFFEIEMMSFRVSDVMMLTGVGLAVMCLSRDPIIYSPVFGTLRSTPKLA